MFVELYHLIPTLALRGGGVLGQQRSYDKSSVALIYDSVSGQDLNQLCTQVTKSN